MSSELRDFLEIAYDRLEEMNLEAKAERLARTAPEKVREKRMRYLTDEKRIKAVTVCFADLEGRLHMLDYDKKFLLKSADNLTFDGSSIRGFSQQAESDLRLAIDWPATWWLPADVFGPGKVLVFADVLEKDGTPYVADIRARQLPQYIGPHPERYHPTVHDWGPIVVPAGHYWVMGDNRDDSRDSRFWGFLPRSHVEGRPLFIYFSVDRDPFRIRWNRLFKVPR